MTVVGSDFGMKGNLLRGCPVTIGRPLHSVKMFRIRISIDVFGKDHLPSIGREFR